MIAAIERLTGVEWKQQTPVFLLGCGHGATHWIAAIFYLLLPFIKADLGLTYAEVGGLATVFHLSAFAANFVSGAVVDVTGRRLRFMVVSLVVGGGALLGVGTVSDFLMLGVMVVLIGATNNLWHPPAIAFLSELFPANRGYALSVHALGANIGDALAPLAAGTLLVWLSWQGTASVGALPVFAIAALIGLTLKPGTVHHGATGKPLGAGDYISGMGKLVRDRVILVMCLMTGFRSMAQMGCLVFLPLYLAGVMGMGPFLMGVVMMAVQIGGMIASPIAGTVSDRIGRRPVVLAGLSVSTVVIFALTLTDNEYVFIGAVAVLGFAMYAARPVIHSWMMDITPPSLSGSATSLMFGAQSGLVAVMMTAGGFIADAWGLTAVFYVLAAIMLVANLLVVALPRHIERVT